MRIVAPIFVFPLPPPKGLLGKKKIYIYKYIYIYIYKEDKKYYLGAGGGLANERPGTDYVICGPMRGFKINNMERGHIQI